MLCRSETDDVHCRAELQYRLEFCPLAGTYIPWLAALFGRWLVAVHGGGVFNAIAGQVFHFESAMDVEDYHGHVHFYLVQQ